MAIEIGLLDGVYKNAEMVCSPRLLVNTNRNPNHIPRAISGKVILKKVVNPEAPRFLEASSYIMLIYHNIKSALRNIQNIMIVDTFLSFF